MKLLLLILFLICGTAKAENFALYNMSTALMTASQSKDEVVPIASITKLFTAVAIIESGVDLEEKVKVQGRNTGKVPLNSMASRAELLKLMLIASDNRAADTLAITFPTGYNKFIEYVNLLISGIGLQHTVIVEPTGISAKNVSTATELVNFAWYLRRHDFITLTSSKAAESVEFDTLRKKHITLKIKNTNPDINKYNILLSKTGFTNIAGRCILLLVEYQNDIYALAILNSKNPKTRSETIQYMIQGR
jgi:D-alanyl-D-alanine endopeptidase (penicillin-binding protein 7)